MSIQEGEDVDEPFFERDWIERGKTYDKTKLPAFVAIAESKKKIPAAHSHPWIELLNTDMEHFRALEMGKKELMDALKCSQKRGMSY